MKPMWPYDPPTDVVVEEEETSSDASSSEVINGSGSSNRQFTSMDEMSLDVLSSSLNVRMKLFEEARNRKLGSTSTTTKNLAIQTAGCGNNAVVIRHC